ncbi:unnamed protein product, partial [Rotaria sp. Silwood2]
VDVLENEQFFGKTGNRTLFQIKCETVNNIKSHSFIPAEEELLLLPARQLQVVASLDSGHGLHIIQLKELKPQFDLIEPIPVANSPAKYISGSSVTSMSESTSVVGVMQQQFSCMTQSANTKHLSQLY